MAPGTAITQVTIRTASNGYVMSVLAAVPGAMPGSTDVVFTSFRDLTAYLAAAGFVPTASTT